MKKISLIVIILVTANMSFAQEALIMNPRVRKTIDLNGRWQYIVDPYETGFYNYRWEEREESDREAYWNSDKPDNKTDRKEFGYTESNTLRVPGDWNSQEEKFLYYEGTIWYKKSFDINLDAGKIAILYFGAVNYDATVYLNGKKLGSHAGGFTPFNFKVPPGILRPIGNELIVKVNNRRYKDEIPTLNTDWWNYGGITRGVSLLILPDQHIRDYSFELARPFAKGESKIIDGWVRFNSQIDDHVTIEIAELKFKKKIPVVGDSVHFSLKLSNAKLWSPESPKLYNVSIRTSTDGIYDNIGLRTIEVENENILLNGQKIFLRGICIHEEIPSEGRRASGYKDALALLKQAKELNANMVRLAHYPHNEAMTRAADSLGLLVWSEIPVYWTIDFSNNYVLEKAKKQLKEMIDRDRNRASVIIWSVGNETPIHPARTRFMSSLVLYAKSLDRNRLISAALEVHKEGPKMIIDDPLGEYTDLIAVNEYLGWYSGLPSFCREAVWEMKYNKPLFFSETGAEALGGYHSDSLTRWSEEYQEWYYREQIKMMSRMPSNYVGMSPWVLNDFRSPKRNHPTYQNGWNNKGLYSREGVKKKAFYILKAYYDFLDVKK